MVIVELWLSEEGKSSSLFKGHECFHIVKQELTPRKHSCSGWKRRNRSELSHQEEEEEEGQKSDRETKKRRGRKMRRSMKERDTVNEMKRKEKRKNKKEEVKEERLWI